MSNAMTPISKSQRVEVQALAEKATAGPWKSDGNMNSPWVHREHPDIGGVVQEYIVKCGSYADGEFIAAARDAVPAYEAALVAAEERSLSNWNRFEKVCGDFDRLEAERDALAAKLAAVSAARDEACDLAMQHWAKRQPHAEQRREAEIVVAKIRAVGKEP